MGWQKGSYDRVCSVAVSLTLCYNTPWYRETHRLTLSPRILKSEGNLTRKSFECWTVNRQKSEEGKESRGEHIHDRVPEHYRLRIHRDLIRNIPALTFGHYGVLGESGSGGKLADETKSNVNNTLACSSTYLPGHVDRFSSAMMVVHQWRQQLS